MKSLPAIICLLLALAAPAFAAPPDDCLNGIGQAIENQDAVAFENLIDLDAILGDAWNLFIAEAQKPENSASVDPVLAMLLAQANGAQGGAIRELILREAKNFALGGVRNGSFAGRSGSGQTQGMLGPLFANASTGRKEIRGVGEPVAYEEGWLMPFTVHDYGNDNDYHVIGRFLRVGNGARLAGIENLSQIFEQIQREAANQ